MTRISSRKRRCSGALASPRRKRIAALGIVLLFRYPVRTALVVAASLAQIGEFSFILAGLGVTLGLLPQEGHSLIPGILDHAHLERARLLVISAPDAFQARLMLELARKVNPDIDTVVRTHSDEERAHLESMGVGRAVVGEREMALAIVRYAFGSYGVQGDMAALAAEMLQLPDPHSGRRGRPRPGAEAPANSPSA